MPRITKSKTLGRQLKDRLLAYATLTGAAACATPAQAEVVYTPTHVRVNGNLYLDLDHDGIADFQIYSFELSGDGSLSVLTPNSVNKVAGILQPCATAPAAAALPAGIMIGPHLKFSGKANCMAKSFSSFFEGPWLDAKDRYLGLVFAIDGQKHYGWVRLSTNTTNGFRYGYTADVFGYAYETTPNQPIMAGDEGTSAETSAPPKTLGALALGATSRSAAKGNE